jgi:hypothetical protein
LIESPRSRLEDRWLAAFALVATALSLGAAFRSAQVQDWTFDEADHLAWSRRLLKTGETERASYLQFNSKTPAVVPSVLAQRAVNRLSGAQGSEDRLRLAARLPTVLWLALLLGAVWVVAWRVAGAAAAHVALLLAASEPNLVAHGSIVSVDVAFTLVACLTLVAAYALACRPTLLRALLLGLALGLAFVAKFAAFLLLPLIPLAAVPALRDVPSPERRRAVLRFASGTALAAIVATFVVCAGYGFADVGAPLATRVWRGQPMQTLARLAPSLPSPVPIDFLTGVDITLAQERSKEWPVLLLGERHPPVWYYYLLHWALKTPLALLAAELVGLLALWRARPRSPACIAAASSLAALVAYFSFAFRAQIGYRHALLCVPLACLLAGVGLARLRARAAIAAAVLLLAFAEQAPYLGNHLAFTNLAVWPKREAYRFVGDSNIDYRQNDDKAAAWVGAQPGAHLDPVHILPGRNVFGITRLYGSEHDWVRRRLQPTGHFRYSHVFFDVNAETFHAFLDAERRLDAEPEDERLCRAAEGGAPLPEGRLALLPPEVAGRVTLVCIEASQPTTLAIRSDAGFAAFGRPRQRRKTWPSVAPGGVVWYGVGSGTHALLLVAQKGEFHGRIEGESGLRVWARSAQLAATGYLPGWEPAAEDP